MRGRLGGDKTDVKQITILNRTIEWRENQLVYKADAKHVKTIVEGMGLQAESKSVCSPIEAAAESDAEECELSKEEVKMFRQLAMTANYLAMDRIDIQFAVNTICRGMSKPSEVGVQRLKRLARYLCGGA